MLDVLVASRPRRQRTRGGAVASVIAHAGVIGLAIAVTTAKPSAAPRRPRVEPVVFDRVIVLRQPVHPRTGPSGTDGGVDEVSLPTRPRVTIETTIAPPASPSALPSVSDIPLVGSDAFRPGAVARSGNGESRDAYPVVADEQPIPSPDNPEPVYPPALRAMNLTGRVEAQFVVDSTGRVEPASIDLRSSDDPLFRDAVRRALLRARFTPARAHGHPVRALVGRSFLFRLER